MSKREIARLLRRLLAQYRERFHERAPQVDAPVPLLVHKRVDVVAVNGGRALHFFFSDPEVPDDGAAVVQMADRKRITRLHDVTLWPPTTRQQKEVERSDPLMQREMVRRVARIEGALYVHFVLYPEDGAMLESIAAVGSRLAEREVARFEGEQLAEEVPDDRVMDAGGGASSSSIHGGGDPSIRPAP